MLMPPPVSETPGFTPRPLVTARSSVLRPGCQIPARFRLSRYRMPTDVLPYSRLHAARRSYPMPGFWYVSYAFVSRCWDKTRDRPPRRRCRRHLSEAPVRARQQVSPPAPLRREREMAPPPDAVTTGQRERH